MIEYATFDDIPAAKQIWMTCFGDNRQYTDFLFNRLVRPENVLLRHLDGEGPVAMLCMQPFTLATPGGNAEGVYVFGVATLPERRGRGFSTELLDDVGRRCREKGIALSALVPAGEKMFEFYRRRGYETAFSVQRAALQAETLLKRNHSCSFRAVDAAIFAEIRNEFYRDRKTFVRWPMEYLAYIDAETRALGGEILAVDLGETEGAVVSYPYKGDVIVKEAAVPDDRLDEVLAGLADRYRTKTGDDAEYRLHLASDVPTSFDSTVTDFAMACWFDPEKRTELASENGRASYMAHVLDGPTLGAELNL